MELNWGDKVNARRAISVAIGFVVGGILFVEGVVAVAKPEVHSQIKLKCTTDVGTFLRYVPFGDKREVIVRKGKEMGFNYGIELSRKRVSIDGQSVWLAQIEPMPFMCILATPAVAPGATASKPTSPPPCHVLYLPDAEVLISADFSEAEQRKILEAISLLQAH